MFQRAEGLASAPSRVEPLDSLAVGVTRASTFPRGVASVATSDQYSRGTNS
jgi:hypothetical protein